MSTGKRREDSKRYDHLSKRVLAGLSFIDKNGDIVRPTRNTPFPPRGGAYGRSPIPADRKKHYDATRAYGPDGQNSRYHTYRPSGQDISGMMGIVAIFASIFFLSTNITGNAIANLSNTTTNYIGLCLLALGCISGFFWLKGKKRK